MESVIQSEIDQKNQSFWNELCGSQLAKELGVIDSSKESLGKFDKFYMDYYPYLEKYLLLNEIKGKKVLEVGLGYGTVSQMLSLSGCEYHGLDIASNAVKMASHRLEQHGLSGDVRQGSMLDCPFADNYFDFLFSIGCFHHTGNLQKCVDQTYRVLKPGGKAMIMVYNKFSLRHWNNWPFKTAKTLALHLLAMHSKGSTEKQRRAYDASSDHKGAPETEFFSVKQIHEIFKHFQNVKVTRENFDEDFGLKIGRVPIYKFPKRAQCLNSKLARNFGLDLYIEVTK